jgi:hypothetical protein
MLRFFTLAFLALALPLSPAHAQSTGRVVASCPGVGFSYPLGGQSSVTIDQNGNVCTTSGPVAAGSGAAGYPAGATPTTGNATGTTGAVVGTLAGVANKFTYICGFNVSSVGGTAASSPITVAGLVGSSQVYQTPVNATAGQVLVTQNFNPCIPSSAVNTAITVTTTAAAGATAVDVNSWGYQQ